MPERIFKIDDTNPMNWEEFHSIIDQLIFKIQKSNISFSATAPILRSGAIPATMIANKLQIIPMVPLQLKYNQQQNGVDVVIPPSTPKNLTAQKQTNILVVESNTNSGKSQRKAFDEIQKILPNAILHYACVTKAYRKETTKNNYTSEFVGCLTDENFEGTDEDNLRPGITVFPWETAEYELNDINMCES